MLNRGEGEGGLQASLMDGPGRGVVFLRGATWEQHNTHVMNESSVVA